ncbi:hypothetical protein ACFV1F_17025 [Streptomyces sp. NPDC059590]|uniref:hypothetical protein n=1 Tax=Streptomyces sp. NPDC059590 TaxID=3346877 RepID=UPI0036A7C44F
MTEPTATPLSDHDAPICAQETARAAGLDIAPSPSELAAIAASIARTWGDRHAEPDDETASTADAGAQLAHAVPLLLAEVTRLRAELNQAHDDRTGACLARWEEEQDNARLRLAWASAQRGRQEARTRIAERDRATRRAFEALIEKHDKAKTERDELLAELSGRDDEARERWIQKQLDETGIRSMDFRNGIAMDIEPARELCAHFVGAARAMLGDAPNYSETKLSFDVKVAESPELYTLVVQRHGPGVLTPHEARQRAEAALAKVLGIVADWCVEANNHGGMDAGDLAWRLEQAGHQLPDKDEAPAPAEEANR